MYYLDDNEANPISNITSITVSNNSLIDESNLVVKLYYKVYQPQIEYYLVDGVKSEPTGQQRELQIKSTSKIISPENIVINTSDDEIILQIKETN